VKILSNFTLFALKLYLPIKGLIKATVFKQFFGGENIENCTKVITQLANEGIATVLNYSVEGNQREKDFENATVEMLRIIDFAKTHSHIPNTCIKLTGIGRFELLKKAAANEKLSDEEKTEYDNFSHRFETICKASAESHLPLLVDAEESWIQDTLDRITEEMMSKYNHERAIVYNTLQMYRHDRLDYFKALIEKAKNQGFRLGVKLVRGAYLEKENERAEKMGRPSPINPTKEATDALYNRALELAIDNIDIVEICAGTHNEKSNRLLAELMHQRSIPNNHPGIIFAQLYGMSDHISFTLAKAGYMVCKYLPYGPVKDTIPYLIRRAEENTSIAGQMGKELRLIREEMKRRKDDRN